MQMSYYVVYCPLDIRIDIYDLIAGALMSV